jgi:broad specificity phosphatase PhoE
MDLDTDQDLLWIAREGLKAPLPDDWKPCKTPDTDEIYYFNFSTGDSAWDHPCDEYYRKLYADQKTKAQDEDKSKQGVKTSKERAASSRLESTVARPVPPETAGLAVARRTTEPAPRSDCSRVFEADSARRADEAVQRPSRRSVRIFLIRHAQSESNLTKDDCHNGRHIGVPLSELGERQARALGRRLAASKVAFESIYASEAVRAQQTAALACAELSHAPALQVVETRFASGASAPAMGICEIAMGGWTGETKSSCNTAEVLRAREADAWEWRPPGLSADEQLPGESYR